MSWAALPLCTDADLGAIEPEATGTDAPWGRTTWSAQRAQAKAELKAWIEADFGAGMSDRILDRWNPDSVFQYTGSAYTDVTSEVSDDTEEDLNLATVFTTFGTDRLYVGSKAVFAGLLVKLLDSLNAATSVLTVKYWGPTGWTSLTVNDGTLNTAGTASFTRSGRITWTVPEDWEARTLNGTADEYFFVELSVSAALTSGTAASQILPIVVDEALKLVSTKLALGYILRGLAAQSANPEEWRQRAQDYLDDAEALYSRLKNSGAIRMDLNRDQVVQPSERQVSRPVRLSRG